MTSMYISINVAAELIRNNIATPEDIDIAVKLGFNPPIGPFELADTTGIDQVLTKIKEISAKYGKYGDL